MAMWRECGVAMAMPGDGRPVSEHSYMISSEISIVV